MGRGSHGCGDEVFGCCLMLTDDVLSMIATWLSQESCRCVCHHEAHSKGGGAWSLVERVAATSAVARPCRRNLLGHLRGNEALPGCQCQS